MATFDWKALVSGIAPTLGTALGGPMAGMAIKVIADKLLGNPNASETEVAAALSQGLSGEQVVALREADNAFAIRMKELDIDILKVNQAGELAYVADTSDARHIFGGSENVFVLGIWILATFALLMLAVLGGLFMLMTGKVDVDPGVLTACGTLIGTIVGYVAANAQQVVSFFYGSSKGSKDSGEAVRSALSESIKQAGEKAA